MAIFFTASELLDIAIGIERNGQLFYGMMVDRARTDSVRSVYRFLVAEEKNHEAVFERMRRDTIKITISESYEGEYMNYLKSLVDSLVFRKPAGINTLVKTDSEIEAISTGIQAEKDSIIFYSEMLTISKLTDRPLLENIIKEERSHLRQLSEIKAYLEESGGNNVYR